MCSFARLIVDKFLALDRQEQRPNKWSKQKTKSHNFVMDGLYGRGRTIRGFPERYNNYYGP